MLPRRTALTGTRCQGGWMSSRADAPGNRLRRAQAYVLAQCRPIQGSAESGARQLASVHAFNEIPRLMEKIYKTAT
jgi:ATP/maltotriose-dependent transcriptional regulator MalT